MGRPRTNDFPPNMTSDVARGGFYVRNPITGKRKRFTDEREARLAAERMAAWVANERKDSAWNGGVATFALLAKKWLVDQLPRQPWSLGTMNNNKYIFQKVADELGDRHLASTSPMFLGEWLDGHCERTDLHVKYRKVLVTLYEFAISLGVITENQALKVLERSSSLKLAINHRVRDVMEIEGFRAIHALAPAWMQIAMELSLLTLQARKEICNMRHVHFRDGYLFVIRDKVSAKSEMGFIKIKLTPELEALRSRALQLDNVLSPFLIHRKPFRRVRTQDHWTYVRPHYLSQRFKRLRTRAGIYEDLPVMQRPGFHMIKGLGGRLLRDRGVSKADIQALMTHSNPKMTALYLEGGAKLLSDDDYRTVEAPLCLTEVLRG
jgi:integrase